MNAARNKQALRERLRRERRDHVAALPAGVRALMFYRPPAPVAAILPKGASVGLYFAHGAEAPTLGYAKWLHENGRTLALPWFSDRDAPMEFRAWADPYDESALERGPFGLLQPHSGAAQVVPDAVFVPLLGFSADGGRLGQGGGHYDRWLHAHPGMAAIGLAWDCQLVDHLPREAHDHHLTMVVTPTRVYERA